MGGHTLERVLCSCSACGLPTSMMALITSNCSTCGLSTSVTALILSNCGLNAGWRRSSWSTPRGSCGSSSRGGESGNGHQRNPRLSVCLSLCVTLPFLVPFLVVPHYLRAISLCPSLWCHTTFAPFPCALPCGVTLPPRAMHLLVPFLVVPRYLRVPNMVHRCRQPPSTHANNGVRHHLLTAFH